MFNQVMPIPSLPPDFCFCLKADSSQPFGVEKDVILSFILACKFYLKAGWSDSLIVNFAVGYMLCEYILYELRLDHANFRSEVFFHAWGVES